MLYASQLHELSMSVHSAFARLTRWRRGLLAFLREDRCGDIETSLAHLRLFVTLAILLSLSSLVLSFSRVHPPSALAILEEFIIWVSAAVAGLAVAAGAYDVALRHLARARAASRRFARSGERRHRRRTRRKQVGLDGRH